MATKKAAPKKVTPPKPPAPKKGRVLTEAESKAMATAMQNSNRTEYRGTGWVEDRGNPNNYTLRQPTLSGFGATKPLVDFNKLGPLAVAPKIKQSEQQRAIERANRNRSKIGGGFGATKPPTPAVAAGMAAQQMKKDAAKKIKKK